VNEDEMAVNEELARGELERKLARYARVRLDPSQAATRRARAAVMDEAWRRHLAAGATAGRDASRTRRGLFAGWGVRRLGGTLAAAVMAGLLVGSSVFAASRAGGPLYGARLVVEDVTLPADPEARLEAELAHSQTRLAEAVDASARGDQGALDASLDAYGRSIAALGSETGTGAERALAAVRVHRAVLESVLDSAPAAAVAGLDQAIARSDVLIGRLEDTLDSGGSPDGAGGGTPGGEATPKATREPKPEATPKATREPKPEATPKATRPPKPEATPAVERTPKPRPTPDPPGQDDADRESGAP
jgi:hypothetical protein